MKPIGKLYPKRTLFLRITQGNATEDRRKYALASTPNGEPIVNSKQTGKWFALDWRDIIELARVAGIDK